MAAITPPPLQVNLLRAPETLAEGDEMEFTLGLGPIAIPWLARITDVTPTSFVDLQVSGPFQHWKHRHSFIPVDEATTDVVDEVEAELRRHPYWGPIGLFMWFNLPLLFAYRGWRTRQQLSQQTVQAADIALVAAAAGIFAAATVLALRLLKLGAREPH